MVSTYTFTHSFTRTHARYLASKVAADLRQMLWFYGDPTPDQIDDYIEESTELLAGGYLQSVKYGFRRNGSWVVALAYHVNSQGTLVEDSRAGRVPIGADVSGASWYSYVCYSWKWSALSEAERQRIKEAIRVKRTPSPEPTTEGGAWVEDKAYSTNGVGVPRRTCQW